MEQRYSVRSYTDRKIEGEVKDKLEQKIKECKEQSGLCMQLVCNEPKAFDSFMALYGKFSGVTNYIAMVGSKGKDLEEKVDLGIAKYHFELGAGKENFIWE